jgi:hypothetical protein
VLDSTIFCLISALCRAVRRAGPGRRPPGRVRRRLPAARATASIQFGELPSIVCNRGARLIGIKPTERGSGPKGRHRLNGALFRPLVAMSQDIRFCTADDGVKLAYAITGDGPPLVMASTWLTHLEHQWRSLAWRPWLEAFNAFTVLRHDSRGCGLSDRATDKLSFENWVRGCRRSAARPGIWLPTAQRVNIGTGRRITTKRNYSPQPIAGRSFAAGRSRSTARQHRLGAWSRVISVHAPK